MGLTLESEKEMLVAGLNSHRQSDLIPVSLPGWLAWWYDVCLESGRSRHHTLLFPLKSHHCLQQLYSSGCPARHYRLSAGAGWPLCRFAVTG